MSGHTELDDYLGEYVNCEADRAVRLAWNDNTEPLETNLPIAGFWTSGEPCGDSSDPGERGSVKTAILYDRGLCGFIVEDLRAEVRDATVRAWNEISTEIYDLLDPNVVAVNRYAHRRPSMWGRRLVLT